MDTKVPKARKIKKNCTWTNEEKRYIKYHDPNGKYALLMDNVRSHKSLVKYPNIDLITLEPNTTGYMQPLDTMVFGILKNQYRSWLASFLLKEGSITEEKAIVKISELFASLGQNAIDYAFKLTEIPKFKYLNADYTGLDEDEKEEYLTERFAELKLREESLKDDVVESEEVQKEIQKAKPKQSKITSFFK